jgi:hypothetical protein
MRDEKKMMWNGVDPEVWTIDGDYFKTTIFDNSNVVYPACFKQSHVFSDEWEEVKKKLPDDPKEAVKSFLTNMLNDISLLTDTYKYIIDEAAQYGIELDIDNEIE